MRCWARTFCVETLEDALARHGKPAIFNTDQGSQFTGSAFTRLLASNGIAISMDGKDAWRGNSRPDLLEARRASVSSRAHQTDKQTHRGNFGGESKLSSLHLPYRAESNGALPSMIDGSIILDFISAVDGLLD